MKKKTVITTERHEVWVIRSRADAIAEQQPVHEDSEADSDQPYPVDSDESASDAELQKE